MKDTYTRAEVIELLESLSTHIRCHIFQYIDKEDLQDVDEWIEDNMK